MWIFYVFVLSCVCYVFVRVCLYVLCGHLLGKGWPLGSPLWCLLWIGHFPIGILGQMWYLIVSIPDLCTLTYLQLIGRWQMSWLAQNKLKNELVHVQYYQRSKAKIFILWIMGFFFRFRVGAGGWDEKSSEYEQLTGYFQSLFFNISRTAKLVK